MLDKMSDTSRIVDRLIKKEFVSKQTCPNDKRLVDVIITEAGLAKLESIDQREFRIEETFGNLTEEEANQLSNLLDKMRESEEDKAQ